MRNSFFTRAGKFGLFSAMILLFLVLSNTALAQVQEVERHAPPMEASPQEQNQLAVTYNDQIKHGELPESVVSSIQNNYNSFKLAEAYRGSDGSYKIKLEKEQEKLAVFYDAGGEFIRVENSNGKEDDNINEDWR